MKRRRLARRGAVVALLGVGTIGIWAFAGEPPASGLRRGSDDGVDLTVLSYNVCFERPDASTVEATLAQGADIVFLQETNQAWEELFDAETVAPLERRFHHHDPDGGLAVLSRYPIERAELRESPEKAFPAWCLRFQTPEGSLDVLSVHLHPPIVDDRLLWGYFLTGERRAREIVAHLECFDGPPDLAVGDFNEEEGEAVDHLASLGLRQAQLAFPPVERTWRWPTELWELSGRPDHVFVGTRFSVASVHVPQVGASDHYPLRVGLRRRP